MTIRRRSPSGPATPADPPRPLEGRERLAFGSASAPGGATVQALSPSALIAAEELHQAELADQAGDWGYWGLLAFTAVLLLRPQDIIPPVAALHLAEIFAIIGLIGLITNRLSRKLPILHVTPEVVGLTLFGLVIAGTIPFSLWPGGAFEVLTGMYLKVILMFVLMTTSLTSPKRLDRFIWLIVFASGYVAVGALISYLRGTNMVETDRVTGSIGGIWGNPNDLALNMVVFLPFAVLLAFRRGASAVSRSMAAAITVLMLAAIVFTKSRSGFLGLIAMVAALLFEARRVRRGVAPAILAAVLLLEARRVQRGVASVILDGVLLAVPLMPDSFWARMDSIFNAKEDETGSREARKLDMRESWRTFLEYPLTGVGAGQFKNYNPPWRVDRWRESHNVWLQVAAETGIFGFLAFLYLVIRAVMAPLSAMRRLGPVRSPAARRTRAPRQTALRGPPGEAGRPQPDNGQTGALRGHVAAVTAGMAGWLVCAFFASVAYNWTFYYLLAIGIAALQLVRLGAVRGKVNALARSPQPARPAA